LSVVLVMNYLCKFYGVFCLNPFKISSNYFLGLSVIAEVLFYPTYFRL